MHISFGFVPFKRFKSFQRLRSLHPTNRIISTIPIFLTVSVVASNKPNHLNNSNLSNDFGRCIQQTESSQQFQSFLRLRSLHATTRLFVPNRYYRPNFTNNTAISEGLTPEILLA